MQLSMKWNIIQPPGFDMLLKMWRAKAKAAAAAAAVAAAAADAAAAAEEEAHEQ